MTIITTIFTAFCLTIVLLSVSSGGNEQGEPTRFNPAFTLADIENVIINNIMEDRDSVKVDPQYFPAIYEGLKTSIYPTPGENYECEPTRKAVIQLKNGKKYSMIYHVQCNAPEYFLRESEEEKAIRLFNLRLKKILMAIEISHLKVRFVRMQRHGDNDIVVISSTTENVYLGGTKSSLSDGKGQQYEIKGELTEDGRVELSIAVTNRRQKDGNSTDQRKAEVNKSFLFGAEELNVEGSAHVVSSVPGELLVMTCEPQLL